MSFDLERPIICGMMEEGPILEVDCHDHLQSGPN